MRVGVALEGQPGLLETRVDVPGGRVTVAYDPAVTSLAAVLNRLDATAQYDVARVLTVREVRDGVAAVISPVAAPTSARSAE